MDKKRKVPSNDSFAVLQILSASDMILFLVRLNKPHTVYYPKLNLMDQYSMEGKNDCSTTCRSCKDSGHIDTIRTGSPPGPGDALRMGCCYINQFA